MWLCDSLCQSYCNGKYICRAKHIAREKEKQGTYRERYQPSWCGVQGCFRYICVGALDKFVKNVMDECMNGRTDGKLLPKVGSIPELVTKSPLMLSESLRNWGIFMTSLVTCLHRMAAKCPPHLLVEAQTPLLVSIYGTH